MPELHEACLVAVQSGAYVIVDSVRDTHWTKALVAADPGVFMRIRAEEIMRMLRYLASKEEFWIGWRMVLNHDRVHALFEADF